jgi:hypothetical protein
MNTKYRNCYHTLAGLSICLLLVGAVLSGCTKKYTDINTSKDNLSADNISSNLVGQAFAESEYAGLSPTPSFQRAQNLFADIYAQYFATTQPSFQSDEFFEVGQWSDFAFQYFYSSAAPQLFFVRNYTRAHDMPVAYAIASIWRVEIYHRMTDYWGPIIYSNFGNGKTSVAYDAQEDIYHDFFNVLDSATAVLKQHPGENAFGSNDLIYNGDADKWLTFANSLRLRLAMRVAYVDPALAKAQAEKAVQDGVMLDNSENAGVLSTTNNVNNLSSITYHYEFAMSASMESVLVGYNDPRLSVYFAEARGGGGYIGVRNGLTTADRPSSLTVNSSFVSLRWMPYYMGGPNPPNRVMCAAEVYFLRAEGALRGWNMNGTAMDLYNEGITASLKEDRVDASDAEINQYIESTNMPIALNDKWNSPPMTNIPVKYDASGSFENQLEQIITQKWLALYPDGWEAWAERRRTGYPKGYALINSLNPNINIYGMMRRLKFTESEVANNEQAVEDARKLLNGDDVNYTRVWWDAKPLNLFPKPTN